MVRKNISTTLSKSTNILKSTRYFFCVILCVGCLSSVSAFAIRHVGSFEHSVDVRFITLHKFSSDYIVNIHYQDPYGELRMMKDQVFSDVSDMTDFSVELLNDHKDVVWSRRYAHQQIPSLPTRAKYRARGFASALRIKEHPSNHLRQQQKIKTGNTPIAADIQRIEVGLVEPPRAGTYTKMYSNSLQQTPLFIKIIMKDGKYVPGLPASHFLSYLSFYQQYTGDSFGINQFKNSVNLSSTENDYQHGVFSPPNDSDYGDNEVCDLTNCYLLNLYVQVQHKKLYSICTAVNSTSLSTCLGQEGTPVIIEAQSPLVYEGNMFSIVNASMDWRLYGTILYVWTNYSYKAEHVIPTLREFVFTDARKPVNDKVCTTDSNARISKKCSIATYKVQVSPGIDSTRLLVNSIENMGAYGRLIATTSQIPNEGYGTHGYTRNIPVRITDIYGNGGNTTVNACWADACPNLYSKPKLKPLNFLKRQIN